MCGATIGPGKPKTKSCAAPLTTDLRTVRLELPITLREAAGHFNAWSGTLSRIERGLSRDTPSLAKSGTGSASKKPKTTISNFRSITYGRSRTTHVRLVQLEMSLRRNHKTAAVVKSRA